MGFTLFWNKNQRRIILALFDIISYILIGFFVFCFAKIFDGFLPDLNDRHYLMGLAIIFGIDFLVRIIAGVYATIWRYTSTRAYFRLVMADFVAACVSVLIIALCKLHNEILYYGIVILANALFALTARFVYRLIYKKNRNKGIVKNNIVNVAILGAGQLGVHLLNELKCNPRSNYNPVLFIDKDLAKIGSMIAGVPVVKEFVAKSEIDKYEISEIIIAIAKLTSVEIERLYQYYIDLGCKVKVYDAPTFSTDDNPVKKRVVRDFQIEDLLFRTPLTINGQKEFEYYRDKTILVTGGGGSIGSELCRQLARCNPRKLIIVDIYENNAYDIQQELTRKYGDSLDLSVEIASVRDRERLEGIFKNYLPDIVFHAAAHKHVPFMEHSGCEAIKNNVMGTYNTADMAEKYGVKKFILISTDKAVNPTNIMGASKRLCEMVIQCRIDSKTCFAAVRFGNVLGSNGSVIPLFKKQIAEGGPVTITDKRIIRYFMTIPEASQLVMQAGSMAQKGELFVLDMGKPVKIYDLALNMIRLSGYEPNIDINIQEIGLRPGEKLYEELLMKTETLAKTENNMIFIEKDTPLTRKEMDEKIARLIDCVDRSKDELGSVKLKNIIKKVVPTFKDPEEINCKANTSEEMKQAVNG